jgi:alanyl-tRNA synthetase
MFKRQLKFVNNIVIIRTLCSNKKLFRSSKSIRTDFLDYFSKNLNHAFIRSSPVLPINDPSIPFVNAGMNQVHFTIHN